MTSDRIVGRADELRGIAAFLDRIPIGPRGLLLEGDAGVGKTTLWRAASDAARQRGITVLSSRAVESESQLSFTSMADVLDPHLDELLPALPHPQRVALEVALLRREPQQLGPDPRAVSVATGSALRMLAEGSPVVISIDDLQWVDPSSARVFSYACRRLGQAPIGMIGARRSGLGTGQPLDMPAVFEGTLDRIDVEPLDEDGIRELLTHHGLELPVPVVRRVFATSGGNPFYALELARALPRDLSPSEPLPVPSTLDELLGSRLHDLLPETRRLLAMSAASASPSLDQLRSSKLVDDLDPLVDEAVRADVIRVRDGKIRFSHPLMAAAAYADATQEEIRAIHGLLADTVDDREERARHLALAAEGPDAETADELDEAATRASARAAPDAAASLSHLAERMTPPNDRTSLVRRTNRTARFLFDAGDLARSLASLREASEIAPSGHDRATILYQLATLSWMDVHTIEPLLRRASDEAEGDLELLAAIHVDLAWCEIYRGRLGVARDEAIASVRSAAGLDEPIRREAAWVSTMVEFLLGGLPGEAVLGAARSRRATLPDDRGLDLSPYTPPADVMGLILMWSGELEEARSILQQEIADYDDRSRLVIRAEALGYLSEIASRAGRWDEAIALARQGYDHSADTGHEAGLGFAGYMVALAAALRGDADRARRHTLDGIRRSRRNGDPFYESCHRAVLGLLELSLGNAAAAHEQLAQAVAFLEEMGSPEPCVIPCLGDEVEALVSLGELDRADVVTTRLADQGRSQGRLWALAVAARCRGLTRAARGDTEGALTALDDAMEMHEALDLPFERARTLLVRGTVERRAKRRREARASIGEALILFEGLGAAAWVTRSREELERVGGRTAGPDALTGTERRVAALAAEGRTNKEIANELFISVKTVEANMTRLMRKLGVGSRREIAGLLSTLAADDGEGRSADA